MLRMQFCVTEIQKTDEDDKYVDDANSKMIFK